jgi:type IV pilus assembly protein PilE
MMQSTRGFTLLELMTVLAIIAIFAIVAIPSYQQYTLRAEQAQARSETLRLSNLLDQWRSRNLTYRNFDLTTQPNILKDPTSTITSTTAQMFMYVPAGSTAANYKYLLRIVDLDTKTSLLANTATGRNYAIRLEPKNPKNKIFLFTSMGFGCQSANGISNADFQAYSGCGVGAEPW